MTKPWRLPAALTITNLKRGPLRLQHVLAIKPPKQTPLKVRVTIDGVDHEQIARYFRYDDEGFLIIGGDDQP